MQSLFANVNNYTMKSESTIKQGYSDCEIRYDTEFKLPVDLRIIEKPSKYLKAGLSSARQGNAIYIWWTDTVCYLLSIL